MILNPLSFFNKALFYLPAVHLQLLSSALLTSSLQLLSWFLHREGELYPLTKNQAQQFSNMLQDGPCPKRVQCKGTTN